MHLLTYTPFKSPIVSKTNEYFGAIESTACSAKQPPTTNTTTATTVINSLATTTSPPVSSVANELNVVRLSNHLSAALHRQYQTCSTTPSYSIDGPSDDSNGTGNRSLNDSNDQFSGI